MIDQNCGGYSLSFHLFNDARVQRPLFLQTFYRSLVSPREAYTSMQNTSGPTDVSLYRLLRVSDSI